MSRPGGASTTHLNGVALETLVAEEFAWQPGWEYRLS